jgi:hypothetical protein
VKIIIKYLENENLGSLGFITLALQSDWWILIFVEEQKTAALRGKAAVV